MMKKRKMIIIASVIAVLGVGLIFFIWHDNSGGSKTSNESSQTTISQESDMNSTTNPSQSNSDSNASDQNESSNSDSQLTSQTNSTSSTTKDSSKNSSTNTSSQASQQNQLPTNVINMLAYVKTYGGPGNVSGQDLIIDGNVIGQGTDDSTGTVAISGNNVSLTIEGKTNTYNINDLAKEYYNTSDQQQKINNLINQGVNQGNKYH